MTRDEAVESLVSFDMPLAALSDSLAGFPWDWEGRPLATLRRHDLLAVLERWQRGDLPAAQVEEWANLLEGRDDLDLDSADPVVAKAVFDLANPMLQGPLEEVGPGLLAKLRA